MTADVRVPGVSREDLLPEPQPALLTGVPVFLSRVDVELPLNTPVLLTSWPQFDARFGSPGGLRTNIRLAVRGFFENGGRRCYVIPIASEAGPFQAPGAGALQAGLAAAAALDEVDLVCAPDLLGFEMTIEGLRPQLDTGLQRMLLEHCAAAGDRLAILDSAPGETADGCRARREALSSDDGALYHPWVVVAGDGGRPVSIPPCGHIAGVYARSDQRAGVHRVPANEVVEGVLDVASVASRGDAALLFEADVNTIRPFTGRGIRVWGGRTLSQDPGWRYVNVRRLFLTVGRWLSRFMDRLAFEPNDVRLWARILRELSAYFDTLHRRGALAGAYPQQAYYIKCDGETNSPEVIERGEVVTEIGLAPTTPNEFIVVRMIRTPGGASIARV